MSELDTLDGAEILALPIDRLALIVLLHLAETNESSTRDFLVGQQPKRQNPLVEAALSEAIGWLLAHVLIAHGKPGQLASESMIITRAGRVALMSGLATLKAGDRLGLDVHSRLMRVQSQFLLGEYELAAFAAMKQVEIRVRELARADPSAIGTSLMKNAFGERGPLADPTLDPGERVGLMELFAGAIATFKNPPSHRQVDYDDPTEASEVVLLADLLLRLLDRVERRIAPKTPPRAPLYGCPTCGRFGWSRGLQRVDGAGEEGGVPQVRKEGRDDLADGQWTGDCGHIVPSDSPLGDFLDRLFPGTVGPLEPNRPEDADDWRPSLTR